MLLLPRFSCKILFLFVFFTPGYSRRQAITISQGDSIHHPHHGICLVQSIRKRSFSGPDGPRYAKLFFAREDMVMLVSEDELSGMVRKPIQKTAAERVLDHIKNWSGSVSEQWKVRANAQQKKLDDGDPFALAEVYKTLAVRQIEDSLSSADRRQLSQSEECLAEELAVALKQPKRKVCRLMEQAARN